jgi:hypothetical protein
MDKTISVVAMALVIGIQALHIGTAHRTLLFTHF